MKISKNGLQKLIKENIEEIDRGDNLIQKSVQTDKLLMELQRHLSSLKDLGKSLASKENPKSTEILKSINISLEGFIQKVVKATSSS